MPEDPVRPATAPRGAVFLSYASQDAAAAARICAALRAAGIEVFLDQSELRGGDVWDQKIRHEIHACALFVPVISANTASRHEGYFRLEWDLADQRSHMMARNRVFIMPVCLDATSESVVDVPESFHRVQWTRLSSGETPPAFVERVRRLLSPEPSAANRDAVGAQVAAKPVGSAPVRAFWRSRPTLLTAGAVAVLAALAYFSVHRPSTSRSTAEMATTAGSSPSAHSIAVLPFLDMSEKKDQEYFADGLAEELLDMLAKTPGLQVIARTSSFSFKGKSDDIPTIAAKLKVVNILEGSVRKSGDRLRVSTQLVRAADGQQLWSETYDRGMKDVFKVQDEIAESVVSALKLTLKPNQTSALGRSSNPDAFLQYLQGQQYFGRQTEAALRESVAAYKRAIALDPHYAAAYAGLAFAEDYLADTLGDAEGFERALAAADRAIELAPDQAMGFLARGDVRMSVRWDWAGAQADFSKALALEPENPFVLRRYAFLPWYLGRLPEAVAVARKGTDLDPYSAPAWRTLALVLWSSGDSPAALRVIDQALAIDPTDMFSAYVAGQIELTDRRTAEALAHFQKIADDSFGQTGIAMAEHSLGHHKESQQAIDQAIAKHAQDSAFQIAGVYAWRGEKDKAFEWLDRAYRQRDGGLLQLKTYPLMASLFDDPRYKALLRKIKLLD